MADLHILSQDGREFTAAYHLAIPASNNSAGVSWRTVVLRTGGGTTTLPDGDGTEGTIAAAEKALIESGALVELVRTERWEAGWPTGAQLDAIHARVSAEYQSDMLARYAHYGETR